MNSFKLISLLALSVSLGACTTSAHHDDHAAMVDANGRSPAQEAQSPCMADALAKAPALLKLHGGGTTLNMSVDPTAKKVGTVKVLVGNGNLDVIEVLGHIYRTDYRMRFLYAQIPGTCALLGQEILESSNPY